MNDFIEFLKLIAKSPPKLSIALLLMALREYWFQSFTTIVAMVGVVALIYLLFRQARWSK